MDVKTGMQRERRATCSHAANYCFNAASITRMPMQQKQIRRCEPALRQLIKVEIAGSGLKASDGFSKALDGYASHYRLKGKKAEIVKAYLAKTAISIAKHDKGIFSSGIKAKLVQPDDVKAAVFFYHLPEFPDDDCSGASRQIMHLEQARPKGTMGQLTPAMSKYLDKLKV